MGFVFRGATLLVRSRFNRPRKEIIVARRERRECFGLLKPRDYSRCYNCRFITVVQVQVKWFT